ERVEHLVLLAGESEQHRGRVGADLRLPIRPPPHTHAGAPVHVHPITSFSPVSRFLAAAGTALWITQGDAHQVWGRDQSGCRVCHSRGMSRHTTSRRDVPGAGTIEVRRSARRRRTVTAFREAGQLVVAIPATFTPAQEEEWIERMVAKVRTSELRR